MIQLDDSDDELQLWMPDLRSTHDKSVRSLMTNGLRALGKRSEKVARKDVSDADPVRISTQLRIVRAGA